MIELAVFWIFSVAAHVLPQPRRGERWYRAIYRAIQLGAANLDRFQAARKTIR